MENVFWVVNEIGATVEGPFDTYAQAERAADDREDASGREFDVASNDDSTIINTYAEVELVVGEGE